MCNQVKQDLFKNVPCLRVGDFPNVDLNLAGFMNQEKQYHCCFV